MSGTGKVLKASRPIFVAATRQHVGKTSVSLALTSGLQKRFDRVGFLKPVGQQVRARRDSDEGAACRGREGRSEREEWGLRRTVVDFTHVRIITLVLSNVAPPETPL